MDYWQYFIDTSQDVNGTGRVCNRVEYKTVRYGKNKKHDANYCVLFDSTRNVIQIHFEKTSTRQAGCATRSNIRRFDTERIKSTMQTTACSLILPAT